MQKKLFLANAVCHIEIQNEARKIQNDKNIYQDTGKILIVHIENWQNGWACIGLTTLLHEFCVGVKFQSHENTKYKWRFEQFRDLCASWVLFEKKER